MRSLSPLSLSACKEPPLNCLFSGDGYYIYYSYVRTGKVLTSNSFKMGDHSDLFTVGRFKLVLFASHLAFGIPVISRGVLTFFGDVLLIEAHQFNKWFDFFSEIKNFFEDKQKTCPARLIFTSEDDDEEALKLQKNCIFYSVTENSGHVIIEITSSFRVKVVVTVADKEADKTDKEADKAKKTEKEVDQKYTFKLSESEFYLFVYGFRTLFFKLYFYSPPVYRAISKTVEKMSLALLKKNDYDKFVKQVGEHYGYITNNELHFVAELLERHRQLIVKWKINLSQFPDCPEDSFIPEQVTDESVGNEQQGTESSQQPSPEVQLFI